MVTGSRLPQIKISNTGDESHADEDDLSLRNVIDSGDFKIDVGGRTLSLCGEEMELSSEEFEVLVYLINHPQRLITANTVLATSWTKKPPRQTEFLRVLLSLRKKLDLAAPGKHYLRTEPWVVYRFDSTPPSRM
jgi:DNA-binding response OmpR family regulator